MKTVLVTGGAGYIGSHTAYLLAQSGYKVIVLDNLVHNQSFLHEWATFIKKDFSDESALENIFTQQKIDAVMHFAAFIEVGESVKNPKIFYENNFVKTLSLLNTMLKHDVKKFIFSSSCAVYGEPKNIPINEAHSFAPISPYGKSKLATEFILQDYANAYDLKYVSLRYFNAAGALPQKGLGERHNPETHIIPLMIRALINGTTFKIFGTDYDTPDGTCIRDYIHVLDIAKAHIQSLEYLEKTGLSNSFNLGSGNGFSVKEMIKTIESLCNRKMNIQCESRRPGDPAVLLADPTKAKNVLGWRPFHSEIKNILNSALDWELFCRNSTTTLQDEISTKMASTHVSHKSKNVL
jgi:UDP-glucose 4-epimerase